MILNCPFCNAKVRPADQDCPACRQRMVRRCPACAESVAANAAACKYCGETLKAGDAPLRVAAAQPDIVFIEETPKKKRKCCGKLLMALVLLAGLGTAAFAVKTDCVACAKVYAHEANVPVSFCNRKICRHGKTPLWATVWEKLGGKVCSKQRNDWL